MLLLGNVIDSTVQFKFRLHILYVDKIGFVVQTCVLMPSMQFEKKQKIKHYSWHHMLIIFIYNCCSFSFCPIHTLKQCLPSKLFM